MYRPPPHAGLSSYSQNLVDRIAELLGTFVISVSPDIRESVKESADCYICALALEEIVSGREEVALKAISSILLFFIDERNE